MRYQTTLLLLQQKADSPWWHFPPNLPAFYLESSHIPFATARFPVYFGFAWGSSLPWLQQTPAKAPA